MQLASDKLIAWIAPSRGGQIYELDVRSICHNLLATLTRRPEAYHRRVKAGPSGAGGSVIDANSPVKFKQAGLENHLQYDTYLRKSLFDHLYDDNVSLDAVARGEAMERGDFLNLPYEAKLRRNPGRIQVQLSRPGNAWGVPIKITKGVTLQCRQQRSGNRLSDRGPAARSTDALFGRVQLRRPALRRRRSLFPRRRHCAITIWANSVRGST